jgi:NAD(P)-dependent dehydrogenase (short-subunit alcohol dehydrogenase family)
MGVLDQKVIVVTGGGRGIGRAIAEAVAAAGGRVVVADTGVNLRGIDTTEKVADEVVMAIRAKGGEAVPFTENVTTMAGAEGAIQTGLAEWSRFDGAVCCAAVLRHGPFQELSEEDFDLVIQTHLKGHFAMFQSAFKVLLDRHEEGSLVGISSGYLSGDAFRSSYRAAKAGVVALTKSAALAGIPYGIRVNAIAPLANTRLTEASNLHFDSDPDDIAPVAVFLLSDMGRDVNGEILTVSGNTMGSWIDPQPSRTARHGQRWQQNDIADVMPWLLERDTGPNPPPLPKTWGDGEPS